MKKIVSSIITLIFLFGISACTIQESIPFELKNEDEVIVITGADSKTILQPLFNFYISSTEIDKVNFSVDDNTIARIENGNELFGVLEGKTFLTARYENYSLTIDVIVSGIQGEDSTQEIGIPIFNFDASDNSGVNSRIITLEDFRENVNVFHTPIGVETRYEVATMDIDNPFTVRLPGVYTFEYEDADGEIVNDISYTILAPEVRNPLGLNNNLIENIITSTFLPSYLRGRLNGDSFDVTERMEFNSFGKYEIEIYFIDYQDNEQILEKFEFNVDPEINVTLSENELIEVQRPLKIQFLNEIQEIYVNDNQVSLNPQGEYIVRQTGLNQIEIRGLGGESRIYLINYTNVIINDFNRYWFAILPLTFISIGTISFKLFKGIRK